MGKTGVSSRVVNTSCRHIPERMPILSRAHAKARQCAKIGELRQALINAGCVSLDQQAGALGLVRSTAWAVLKGAHKASGLTASVIKRMLVSPTLPQEAKRVIEEYVEEKSAGLYGHRENRLRTFRARLGGLPAVSTMRGLCAAE